MGAVAANQIGASFAEPCAFLAHASAMATMGSVRWADEIIDGVTVHHRHVRGDGVDLHVAMAGDGPPVILLHGFPENWRSWRKQVRTLVDAGLSVWMPDMRGYNWSARPSCA